MEGGLSSHQQDWTPEHLPGSQQPNKVVGRLEEWSDVAAAGTAGTAVIVHAVMQSQQRARSRSSQDV